MELRIRDYLFIMMLMMVCTFVPVKALSGDNIQERAKGNLYAGSIKAVAESTRSSLFIAQASVKENHTYETALGNIEENASLGIEAYDEEKELKEARQKEESERLDEEIEEKNMVINESANVPNEDPMCRSYAFSYMYGMNITSVNSMQYKFIHSGSVMPDDNGYLIDSDGRYLVAVGTYFANNIGDKIDILFDDGTILKCVVGDFKADRHTDETHRYYKGYLDEDGAFHQGDGSVLEFILDYDTWNNTRLPQFETVHKIVNITKIGE